MEASTSIQYYFYTDQNDRKMCLHIHCYIKFSRIAAIALQIVHIDYLSIQRPSSVDNNNVYHINSRKAVNPQHLIEIFDYFSNHLLCTSDRCSTAY